MNFDPDPDPDPDPDSCGDRRPSPIAGLWYSGNPKHLSQEIDEYIQTAELPEFKGEVCGLIAPHAGYRYSGATAGYAFKTVLGKSFDFVALVSPCHAYYPDSILTTDHQCYQTPLGDIEVDHALIEELDQLLQQSNMQRISKVREDQEHSLEIELPFLQRALAGQFRLLPLMLRERSVSYLKKFGQALAQVLQDKNALLVASTDLSHFYTEQTAWGYDQAILNHIRDYAPEKILQAEETGKGFACGGGAVAAVLWAAQPAGASHTKILNYSTSAAASGDTSSVVGYGAAVILK